jgi:alkylated DNA repair protein alkB homolog 1
VLVDWSPWKNSAVRNDRLSVNNVVPCCRRDRLTVLLQNLSSDNAAMIDLDARLKPPEILRSHFKHWQRASLRDLTDSEEVWDAERRSLRPNHVAPMPPGDIDTPDSSSNARVLEVDGMPGASMLWEAAIGLIVVGLFFYSQLVERDEQVRLLDSMIHRDLSNPVHQTNLHFHHELPYRSLKHVESGQPRSFFELAPDTPLPPKDATTHNPISVSQMLRRKLRWMTLGGQYDWTRKVYPDEIPPPFPEDVASILRTHFPTIDAQAAIVNFYSPGDILSMHRDVSEECEVGLISISIGCDAIFLVANEDASKIVALRLRSGDAVLMSGQSRFAWHGISRVIPDTCPPLLQEWPNVNDDGRYLQWRDWLKSKRINLNVRQMRPSTS